MKTHSAPYVPISKTREQIAEHIAQGFPSPVSYSVTKMMPSVIMPGYVHTIPVPPPVHLRRAVDYQVRKTFGRFKG